MRKFVLFVLLFSIKSQLVFADTFVVTTNADSGVGSLRTAITLAAGNGIAVVDSIIFTIADTSRAGRSITIGDELPDLSSNLVIDGTTQTGQRIGWSDAKIILLLSTRRAGISFNFLKFEAANNIQIFGLFFHKTFSTIFTPPASAATGVKFFQCTNITIGKPGKGNYFRGVEWGIDNRGTNYIRNSENISIQSNVFGYNEYGEASVQDSTGSSLLADAMEFVIFSQNSKNIIIGGETDIEGNYFYGTNLIVQSDTSDNGVLDLKNNKAGIKMDGTDICQQIFLKSALSLAT